MRRPCHEVNIPQFKYQGLARTRSERRRDPAGTLILEACGEVEVAALPDEVGLARPPSDAEATE